MNKSFFCIGSKKKNLSGIKHLESACNKYNLRFILINTAKTKVKYKARKGDIVFRIGTEETYKRIEKQLLTPKVASFYKSYHIAQKYTGSNLEQINAHKKNHIPIPDYITKIPNNPSDRKKIKKIGFPVIVKAGKRQYKGIGVIKIDSFASLISLTDYLEYIKQPYIIKKYVEIPPPVYSIRSVIINDKIDFSYKITNYNNDEFRSHCNSNKIIREIVNVPDKDKRILIKSVNVLGLELGAIDYVYDKKGNIKIFEVNFPFNYYRIIENFNYPIHEKMIDYLVNKSKSLS